MTTRAPSSQPTATGHRPRWRTRAGTTPHVACLLGAARLLSDPREAWSGTLVALFQPSEELGDGARGMVDDGLASLIPTPDAALAQHVLVNRAGAVGPHAGPFLSMADSIHITLYGRGSHGSMPHLSIDPAVLASMVVVRLQEVVSREVQPGEFAVLTVGKIAVGAKSNIIDDHAVLELNIRTYSKPVRNQLLEAIERIAKAESAASGTVVDFGRQTASEDFSDVPTALGVPYTYWGVGMEEPDTWAKAVQSGIVSSLPANHSPKFAPALQPTLTNGTAALVVGAAAWLGKD